MAEKPKGKFLFQPMFVWADSEVSHQGTGYIIEHEEKIFGVTSIHFLNFNGPGLHEALWLDIPEYTVVQDFSHSLGKPKARTIDTYSEIKHDFLLLPAKAVFPIKYKPLRFDDRKTLEKKEPLWFPNKDFESELGYSWVEAELLNDHGSYLEVVLKEKVALQSQSGSPFISQRTGRVVGMLMGGGEEDGRIVLSLCPTRFALKWLNNQPPEIPLTKAIK